MLLLAVMRCCCYCRAARAPPRRRRPAAAAATRAATNDEGPLPTPTTACPHAVLGNFPPFEGRCVVVLVTMVALVKPRFDCFSNLIGLIYSSSLGNGKPCTRLTRRYLRPLVTGSVSRSTCKHRSRIWVSRAVFDNACLIWYGNPSSVIDELVVVLKQDATTNGTCRVHSFSSGTSMDCHDASIPNPQALRMRPSSSLLTCTM
jgi:hypothetical protein